MINRRSFLKLSIALPALAFIPTQLNLVTGHRHGNVYEDGKCITLKSGVRYDNLPIRILNILHEDAKYMLLPGTLYELRGIIPINFGRYRQVAWYYNRYMTIQANQQFRLLPEDGYIFISQHRA